MSMLLHTTLVTGVRKAFVVSNIAGVRQSDKSPSTCFILDTNSIEFEVSTTYDDLIEDLETLATDKRFDRFVLAALASVGDAGFDNIEMAQCAVSLAEQIIIAIEGSVQAG